MSPVNQFKSFERKMTQQAKKGLWGAFQRLGQFFSRVWRVGRQNFTIMLIPHSEKKIINFKVSVFALVFIGLIGLTLIGFSWWFSTNYTSLNRLLAQKSDSLESAQAGLDMVREEVSQLHRVAAQFQESLDSTLSAMGKEMPKDNAENQSHGDLASFLNLQQVDQGAIHEVGELKNLRVYLQKTTEPMAQISSMLTAQKSILVDIPTLWPLKGTRGWLTNPFGPSIHPFTGQWYLHKGVDLAAGFGTPILATANGKVMKVDYDALGYGNYIDLKHNFGFYTKYGHLSRTYVTKGQDVSRGQLIGAMGTTGLSTGPHLHYEIHIGTQLVDPTKYLMISNDLFDGKDD